MSGMEDPLRWIQRMAVKEEVSQGALNRISDNYWYATAYLNRHYSNTVLSESWACFYSEDSEECFEFLRALNFAANFIKKIDLLVKIETARKLSSPLEPLFFQERPRQIWGPNFINFLRRYGGGISKILQEHKVAESSLKSFQIYEPLKTPETAALFWEQRPQKSKMPILKRSSKIIPLNADGKKSLKIIHEESAEEGTSASMGNTQSDEGMIMVEGTRAVDKEGSSHSSCCVIS